MALYFIAITFLLMTLSGWLLMRKLASDFARNHPEFGPAREEGHGCGACAGDSCSGKCH